MQILRYFWRRIWLARDTEAYVPVYAEPDLERIANPDPQKIQLTWIGHATFLVQMAGMNILTDPIWSERASPLSFAGPRRHARPGLAFLDLPRIDVVLVSHTHYDHLDRPTILALGNAPRYVVPARTKWWFVRRGITNVAELDWWEREKIGALNLCGTPAKHWSKRNIFRTNDAGWSGWIVESPAGVLYFAGDTGYDSDYFKEIGTRRAIDVALVPIGAYYPQWIFGRSHIDPAQAVQVHREIGAQHSVGMHWGTFKLTEEPLAEPPLELARQANIAGLSPAEFSIMKIGETRTA